MRRSSSRAAIALFMKDDRGFSTLGMLIALLITISLLFTAARVYEINTASAEIQDVADAAALAAENQVGEFMILVRVCDTVILSLSLASLAATGFGVVLSVVPGAAALGKKCLSAGENLMDARDDYAEQSCAALNRISQALPFAAAVAASAVATSNSGGLLDARYFACAFLVSPDGEEIVCGLDDSDELRREASENADELQRSASQAEAYADSANEAKQRAYDHDCGFSPNYCQYERAETLASMKGRDNPYFTTIDTWSFQDAFDRAERYYARRLLIERPESASVAEQVKSIMRKRFFEYALDVVSATTIVDDGTTFTAIAEKLYTTTAEMRTTTLYTEPIYPVSSSGSERYVHAWSGCPACSHVLGYVSISTMEGGSYATCPTCGFTAASLGQVPQASGVIDNGFEYHYNAIVDALHDYREARSEMEPSVARAHEIAQSIFDGIEDALDDVCSKRLKCTPPGEYGAIALVVNTQTNAHTKMSDTLVQENSTLGARAAVSAATLVEDDSDDASTVISALLDGLKSQVSGIGVVDCVMDGWSKILQAYNTGQDAIASGLDEMFATTSTYSASGLGSWAAKAFRRAMESLGLEPARIFALKAVTVNSAYVAEHGESTFAVRYLALKERVVSLPASSTDVFASIATEIETQALEAVSGILDGEIVIATIRPFGALSSELSLTITLPSCVQNAAQGIVGDTMAAIRSLFAQISTRKVWQ